MGRASSLALLGVLLNGWPASAAEHIVFNRRIENGQTLVKALFVAGIAATQVEQIVNALRGVFDFHRSRVGDQLRIAVRDGEIEFIEYRQGALDEWQVRRAGDQFVGAKRAVQIEKQVGVVDLRIDSSLYQAAVAAGEDPALPVAISEVFAWDIDFYQDVRQGDRVRAVIEKIVAKGRVLRYGEVLAASYQGASVGLKKVFRYQLPSGEVSYFQEDGKSARKAFLRSPLKYANISSRFGSRFHPVLQYLKEHKGVDYRAEVGTPVWAVADGTVTRAAIDSGSGKHLCLRHMNSMETCYLHLSAFGSGIRVGAHVLQKQVIGYTGNTGLTTGPHLHFALKRGGQFVNPLSQKFPRAEPVPTALLPDFAGQIATWLSRLDPKVAATAQAERSE